MKQTAIAKISRLNEKNITKLLIYTFSSIICNFINHLEITWFPW